MQFFNFVLFTGNEIFFNSSSDASTDLLIVERTTAGGDCQTEKQSGIKMAEYIDGGFMIDLF